MSLCLNLFFLLWFLQVLMKCRVSQLPRGPKVEVWKCEQISYLFSVSPPLLAVYPAWDQWLFYVNSTSILHKFTEGAPGLRLRDKPQDIQVDLNFRERTHRYCKCANGHRIVQGINLDLKKNVYLYISKVQVSLNVLCFYLLYLATKRVARNLLGYQIFEMGRKAPASLSDSHSPVAP